MAFGCAWGSNGQMRSIQANGFLLALAACGSTGASAPDSGVPDSGAPDSGAPDAPVQHALVIEKVEDLGVVPLPSTVTVGRDGGQSGMLGGKVLWTFGDTFLSAHNPIDNSSVLSATSGWSTVAEPLALVEPVDANGFPAQLIPYTPTELAANQADPLNGWALWPGFMIDTGNGEGVVFFQRIKRTNGSGFASEGTATARIAVDATVATRAPEDLFAPPERLFMPQSVVDGIVYAWSCESVGFLNIGCRIARAPVAGVDVRGSYQFYDGTRWQSDAAAAAVVIDHVAAGPTLSWNPYLGRYLAVTGGVLSSTVMLRTADQVEGPWSDPVMIEAGTTGILAPTAANSFNYIIIEHPELRSADGRSIEISYSRPTGPFRGDVRLARITFQ